MEAARLQRLLHMQNRRARTSPADVIMWSGQPEEPAEPEDTSSSDEPDDDRSSDSASSSDEEEEKKKKKKKKEKKSKDAEKDKKKKSTAKPVGADGAMDLGKFATLLAALSKPVSTSTATSSALPDSILSDPLSLPPAPATKSSASASATEIAQQVVQLLKQDELIRQNQATPAKIGSKVAFKRVDQVYDRKIHNYKLKETVQADTQHDKWDQVKSIVLAF